MITAWRFNLFSEFEKKIIIFKVRVLVISYVTFWWPEYILLCDFLQPIFLRRNTIDNFGSANIRWNIVLHPEATQKLKN